ncbi:MAG: UDP-N-acetylglucosamine 2-epimerase (non-hydrolyzing) [Acidobacteria bacterium]|nr:UDP-N-acetylglucosamine 2-epimerase (non-hydrolyzing) [Acidobacteriota bacterium]
MKVLHVAGARPNFMKVAPVLRALGGRGVANVLVHTGQHYDPQMSAAFFEDLGLPEPDVHLEVGSGSHAAQTARVMERIEPVLESERPDLTIVVGDVNSTMASAIVCAKLRLPVAHVEAGLRSFDRTMPEEINRVLTDQISDLLFTTSPEAEANLLREGIAAERIRFVGNPMIDSLERHAARARSSGALERFGLEESGYVLVTLHRPSNVDDPTTLRGILEALNDVARRAPVVFPVHPRTVRMLQAHGLEGSVRLGGDRAAPGAVTCVEPLGYVDFLRLMSCARAVLTDSGGIQEETTILGVPCLTLRWNTERPITVEMGTNRLVGTDPEAIRKEALAALDGGRRPARRPPLWDGKAGERIAEAVVGWAR